MRTRYALAAAGAAAVALVLAADLAPLRAGVDTPPFAVTVPFDPYTVIIGPGAGASLQSGSSTNTLGGYMAGGAITTNTYNTLYGYKAGVNFTGTSSNHALTAFGAGASVTTGADNVFFGADAGNNDEGTGPITGVNNNGFGTHTLGHLGSGSFNLAIGNESMVGCGAWSGVPSCPLLTGGSNIGEGAGSLGNIQGAAYENQANGYNAGAKLTTGYQNIFLGAYSGANSVTTGYLNILIGRDVRVPSDTGNGQLNIGNLITGAGMMQGGTPPSGGTVNIAGTLTLGTPLAGQQGGTGGGSGTAYVSVNGANEVDFLNAVNGNYVFKAFGGYGGSYLVAQGGGGSTLQLYNGASAGLTQIGATGETTELIGQQVPVAAKTTNYALLATDSGTCFDNAAASGEVDFTLPTPAPGLNYCFVVATAQTLKIITPSGTNIAIDTSNSASGGNITASSAFASVTLVALNTTQWATRAVSSPSSWTVH